jgi:hypothetical protein
MMLKCGDDDDKILLKCGDDDDANVGTMIRFR